MSGEKSPLVTVKIITYNHASSICRCIESALMQRTTFPFEIVIGEDCSTDGTRAIVRKYAQRFPRIIKVVTSDANVGLLANSDRANTACRGEYIAKCDGDDYWIDPLKLQKQFEAAKEYGAVMAVHASINLQYEGERLKNASLDQFQSETGLLKVEDIILRSSDFHSSSFFGKSEIFIKKPDWYYQAISGGDLDVAFKLFVAGSGKIVYLNEIMSAYQSGQRGSWMANTMEKIAGDEQRLLNYQKANLEMYKKFDVFSGHRYTGAIQSRIRAILEKHFVVFGNLNLLDLADNKKKRINMVGALSRLAPARVRAGVAQKVVDDVMSRLA